MKVRIRNMIIFNCICALMVICGIVLGILLQNYFVMMGLCAAIFLIFAAGNFIILMGKQGDDETDEVMNDKDIIRKLTQKRSEEALNRYSDILLKYYNSLNKKTPVFEEIEDEGMQKAYALVDQQIRSNIKSAVQFMDSYSKGDNIAYLEELTDSTRILIGRLGELTEYKIRLDSIPDDCDTNFVNDFIESLKTMMH